MVRPYYQPQGSVIGKVIGHPIKEGDSLVSMADQGHNMDQHPYYPGKCSVKFPFR